MILRRIVGLASILIGILGGCWHLHYSPQWNHHEVNMLKNKNEMQAERIQGVKKVLLLHKMQAGGRSECEMIVMIWLKQCASSSWLLKSDGNDDKSWKGLQEREETRSCCMKNMQESLVSEDCASWTPPATTTSGAVVVVWCWEFWTSCILWSFIKAEIYMQVANAGWGGCWGVMRLVLPLIMRRGVAVVRMQRVVPLLMHDAHVKKVWGVPRIQKHLHASGGGGFIHQQRAYHQKDQVPIVVHTNCCKKAAVGSCCWWQAVRSWGEVVLADVTPQ